MAPGRGLPGTAISDGRRLQRSRRRRDKGNARRHGENIPRHAGDERSPIAVDVLQHYVLHAMRVVTSVWISDLAAGGLSAAARLTCRCASNRPAFARPLARMTIGPKSTMKSPRFHMTPADAARRCRQQLAGIHALGLLTLSSRSRLQSTSMVEGACLPAPPHASRMNDEAQVELVRCEG